MATLVDTSNHNNTNYNIEEAHLNESLLDTRNILSQFLERLKKQDFGDRNDKEVLEELEKVVCKKIKKAYKNPDLDD